MKAGLAKLATACVATALLAGCAGIREHRGTVIDTELVSSVQVGVDNKDSVQRVLGRPTFAGAFSDNDWYYVSQEARTVAFKSQKVEDQEVLHITFDAAGDWTVRYHFYEDCNDAPEDSPHGHAAFLVHVP